MTFSGGFVKAFRPAFDLGLTARNGLLNALVAYWKLDETSGTRNDSHGSNHLAESAAVGYAAGKISSAAAFSGGGEKLTVADNAALSTGDVDFTLSAWVYLTSKASIQTFVAKGENNFFASGVEYGLQYNNTADRFRFVISDGSTFPYAQADNLGAVSINTWYLLIGWHDAATSTIYIAVNAGTPDSTSLGATTIRDSAGGSAIGDWISGTSRPAVGRVDEVAMWKSAAGGGGVLTAAQRTALYNAGNGLAYAQFTT